MNDSTSGHVLNADTGLSSWRKFVYLAANAFNDVKPGPVDPRLNVVPFQPQVSHDEWMSIDKGASMARKWSNLFWMRLPWDDLARAAGALHIVDMGCGPGGYGPRILGWGGRAVASYLGIEPSPRHRERWHALMQGQPRLAYAQGSADDIEKFLEGPVNMFISQSSLEHIDRDLLLFRRVARSLEDRPRPFVQVHLVPAGSALPLYLFHGIRQYTPRTLSPVAGLFSDASAALYGLGGRSSWWLHWKMVTWPHVIRRRADRRSGPGYDEATWQAFSADVRRGRGPALFYALVLSHGIRSDIIQRLSED